MQEGQEIKTRLEQGRIRGPDEILEVIRLVKNSQIIKSNKKIEYYNIPCAFDIETTSFYTCRTDGAVDKAALMYEWTLGLDGYVIIGRTWDDFQKCLDVIKSELSLHENRRLILYVHNLSFEFQFICRRFEWKKVFALNSRKPIQAITTDGIEFRCSYMLSGYSLKKLGDELLKYNVQKMSGDLDYSLIRNQDTFLSEKELKYCENDVRVVMCYIQECIERAHNNISLVPLTRTGYVRKYCRDACLYNKQNKKDRTKYHNYRKLMNSMILKPEEYEQLKDGFQGGFTHANPFYSGRVLHDVASYDFTSSYPAVMISEQFPMSSSTLCNITSNEQLEEYLDKYCCLFDIEVSGLESAHRYESPLSSSRCVELINPVTNNGRLVSADHLVTTVTEQDFMVYRYFYNWDECNIYNFRRYHKGYLPRDFVISILDLYESKTTLKGVEGKEVEYMRSKEMINSCYGMTVTDICRDDIIYDGDWKKSEVDLNHSLSKYNYTNNRFLFYPWGVWVTAYARNNLFTGIVEFADDYEYADTDSVKVLNYSTHLEYIDWYNSMISDKLHDAMDYHEIDFSRVKPRTIQGVEKMLGVWDFEGIYDTFKTLGAKRYMTYKNGKYNITVSGLNKNVVVPYMLKTYGEENMFDAFEEGLYIPAEYTGKNIHTYIDEEIAGTITDYQGHTSLYHEYSGVHLTGADYSMSLAANYIDYLKGIRQEVL